MVVIRLVFLICLCGAGFFAEAGQAVPDSLAVRSIPFVSQKKPSANIVLKSDSNQVQLRSFDSRQMQKYSNQQDFKYDDNTPASQSLWQKFWSWFWSFLDRLLGNSATGKTLQYVVVLLLAAFAVFAVVKFSGLDIKIFARNSKMIEVPYSESLENIHEIDFAGQMEAAIANGNFRLAVRLYYLRTLKHLSDRNMISWQPEKTNSVYVNEISDLSIRQPFAQLTLSFEYVWYGDFYIDRDNFNLLKTRFDTFNKMG